MTIKIGLALPYNQTRHVARWAQLAEEAGWDGCFLGDAIWCEDPMIALAAAAMTTSRIRLGTMIVPVPLRRPWKVASESIALDLLSGGRMILGLGAGATWMGWHAFPDEVTDTKARAEMLDETIDILTLLFQRKQFDFDGKHYHLNLTTLDEMYYPPKPIQQPRIPIWIPGIWLRKKSMQRTLKCDGVIPEKLSPEGEPEKITPDDVRQIKRFVEANRERSTPFDIVITGKTRDLNKNEQQEKVMPWLDAGATWWVEDLLSDAEEAVVDRIRSGPPQLDL